MPCIAKVGKMQDVTTNKKPLTTAEVAQRFHVDRQTILNWVRAKKLEPIAKLGSGPTGGYIFDAAYIDEMVAQS